MRGSIIRRGSRYSVVVDVGRDPTIGKRIREWHSGYETRKAAERARVEILHALDNGGHVPRSTLPWGSTSSTSGCLPGTAATGGRQRTSGSSRGRHL